MLERQLAIQATAADMLDTKLAGSGCKGDHDCCLNETEFVFGHACILAPAQDT